MELLAVGTINVSEQVSLIHSRGPTMQMPMLSLMLCAMAALFVMLLAQAFENGKPHKTRSTKSSTSGPTTVLRALTGNAARTIFLKNRLQLGTVSSP